MHQRRINTYMAMLAITVVGGFATLMIVRAAEIPEEANAYDYSALDKPMSANAMP